MSIYDGVTGLLTQKSDARTDVQRDPVDRLPVGDIRGQKVKVRRSRSRSWLATSDFLMIDSATATMRHHLRADKVDFWSHLIPTVWDDYRLQRRHGALLGDDARCLATLAGARLAMWILGGLVAVLAALLVICALLAARYHCQYRRLSVSTRQDSVAKI